MKTVQDDSPLAPEERILTPDLHPCFEPLCIYESHDELHEQAAHFHEALVIREERYFLVVQRLETSDQWELEVYATDCFIDEATTAKLIAHLTEARERLIALNELRSKDV